MGRNTEVREMLYEHIKRWDLPSGEKAKDLSKCAAKKIMKGLPGHVILDRDMASDSEFRKFLKDLGKWVDKNPQKVIDLFGRHGYRRDNWTDEIFPLMRNFKQYWSGNWGC